MAGYTYEQLKGIADAVRNERLLNRDTPTYPHTSAQVPSRKGDGRTIEVQIYEPDNAPSKGPVVVNFHGSGFVIPSLGQNGPYCDYLKRKLSVRGEQ